ncbi:MAG: response regulator [Spirochaetales bacterium]|nr:response regulator [Spirochaetales bacterium]
MVNIWLKTGGIVLYMVIFYFLMNMGRKENKNTLPYLLLCASAIAVVLVIRLYPLLPGFSPFLFITAKTAGGSLVGLALINLVYAIFKPEQLKRLFRILAGILCAANVVFLTVFAVTRNEIIMIVLHGIIICAAFFLLVVSASHIIRYRKYKDRRKRLILLAFPLYILNGVGFMVYKGIFDGSSPFFLQPTIIALTVLYISAFISGLRWKHRVILEQNTILEREIAGKTRELQQTHLQKSMIFANLAHETKTPLTLIRNSLDQYIARNGESHETRIITENVEKLVRNISNIMNAEKLAQRDTPFNNNISLNISDIIRQKTESFKNTAESGRITISVDLAENIYSRIDGRVIDIVMNNLLDNAIMRTGSGGRISVSLRESDGQILLGIRYGSTGKTGTALSPGEMEFSRISHSIRKDGNDKPWLYFIRSVVAGCGGRISIESSKNEETVIRVILPVKTKRDEREHIAGYKMEKQRGKRLRNIYINEHTPTVLVVESDPKLLFLLQEQIGTMYNFYFARNGKEALRRLEQGPVPDLILSDTLNENADGRGFYAKIKASDELSAIPFIYVTEKNNENEIINVLNEGIFTCIRKPCSVDILMAEIQAVLAEQKRHANKLISGIYRKLGDIIQEGNRYISGPAVTDKHFSVMQNRMKYEFGMSEREAEICTLITVGSGYSDIALKLGLSGNTIKTFRKRIFMKCRVQNKAELVGLFTGGQDQKRLLPVLESAARK